MKPKLAGMILAAVVLLSSGVWAAPAAVGLDRGQTVISYSYSDLNDNFKYNAMGLDTDFSNANQESIYAQTALFEHWLLGIDYVTGDATKKIAGQNMKLEHLHTDFFIQYQFNSYFGLVLGSREYNHKIFVNGIRFMTYDDAFLLYGLTAATRFNDRWNGYVVALNNEVETDLQIGTTYALTDNIFVDLNYKSNVFEEKSLGAKIKTTGAGFGLGFKF